MNTNFLSNPAALAVLDAAQAPKSRLDVAEEDTKMVADSAASYALSQVSMAAAASVQAWVETDDLAEGEGAADRLIAMLIGIADDNKDGELSEEEQEIVQIAMNEAWDYLSAKGVADSDLDTIFNADDPADANAAAARVMEFMADRLPDGEEASSDEVDDFAFGGKAGESVFDAVYKKRFAIRKGKKVRINKRVSGTIRLSAAQKVSIRKALRKAHGSRATAKRMKSMRVRRSMSL